MFNVEDAGNFVHVLHGHDIHAHGVVCVRARLFVIPFKHALSQTVYFICWSGEVDVEF